MFTDGLVIFHDILYFKNGMTGSLFHKMRLEGKFGIKNNVAISVHKCRNRCKLINSIKVQTITT